MASFSPFIGLPAEVRVKIYDRIFGASEVITPVKGGNTTLNGYCLLQPGATAFSTKPRLHTAILRASKLIYKESLDVLYKNRTVRGNIEQVRDLLCNKTFRDHVGRIEIEAEVDDCTKEPRIRTFAPTLLQLQALPRNPSIVILSDRLGLIDNTGEGYVTVREFVRRTYLGQALCTDIGRFSLSGRFKDIQILHRKLVKMWPEVVNAPNDYYVCGDVQAVIEATPLHPWLLRVPAWAAQTSLRRWVGLTGYEHAVIRRFDLSVRRLSHRHPTVIGNRFLHSLRPDDNHSILEAATDLISINVAAYYAEVGQYRNIEAPRLCAAHWAEADGGMHTLDIMCTHAMSAVRGEVNAHYLSHPVVTDSLAETSEVRAFLRSHQPHRIWRAANDLSPEEIRQIYLLYLCFDNLGAPGPEEQQAMDRWSLQLLKHYLLAARRVHAKKVKNATLQDVRLAMRCLYTLLRRVENIGELPLDRHRELKHGDDPTNELDTRLVRHLAWGYNGILVHFWRTIVQESLGECQDRRRVAIRCLEVLNLQSRQGQADQAAAAGGWDEG